jgi:transcription elongation factor GreB
MSRAFVDESESQSEEDAPELKIPLPQGSRNYMTPAGAERLRSELNALLTADRPRLMAEISRQVSESTAVDKAPLAAFRTRLAEMDRRIEYLSRMAALTEVVDPARQKSDRVMFGATVTVREDGDGEHVYRIVGVDESDPPRGLVSWVSPVARALVSKHIGDTAILRLPEGEKRLAILKVEYTA